MKSNPKLFKMAELKMLEHEFEGAWASLDYDKCVDLLSRILRIQPKNTTALLLLGRIHGIQHDYDAATDWFDRAIDRSTVNQRTEVTIEAGKAAMDFYDPSIADSLLEDVICTAGSVEAKITLAAHLMKTRKRDLARNLIDEVLRDDPDHSKARLFDCLLNGSQNPHSIDNLRKLTDCRESDVRIKAGYQIASVLDLAGDYDGAMAALVEAKSHLMDSRTGFVEARGRTRLRLEALSKSFGDAECREWAESLSAITAPRKMAFLGGHPRSGTTLLEQVLDSHPDIVSAEETNIFHLSAYTPLCKPHKSEGGILEQLKSCSLAEIEVARSRYFSIMDNCLPQPVGSRLLVDKNPSLTPLIPAMMRILPETKFLIMIRDPRDVILSCFMQSFHPLNRISGNFLTLEDTVAEYIGLMSNWFESSKSLEGRFLEIRYENLTVNLEDEARRVFEFIGVPWNETVLSFDRHARSKVVRSPTADAVTEKIHTRATNRWKNYQKHFEPFREQLAPCLKILGYPD